jgi:hypothetical protein
MKERKSTRVEVSTQRKGRLAGAALGGLVLGPAGALLGAAVGTRTETKVRIEETAPKLVRVPRTPTPPMTWQQVPIALGLIFAVPTLAIWAVWHLLLWIF